MMTIKTSKNSVTMSGREFSHDGDLIIAVTMHVMAARVEVAGMMPLFVGNDSPIKQLGWVEMASFEVPADMPADVRREIVIMARRMIAERMTE
jgi:hypothetical protein